MKYLVLTWQSLSIREYRSGGMYDDEQTAWAVASKHWQNPRVRLALVVAVPPKDLQRLLREDAEIPQRFTIPREITGNEPLNPPEEKKGWSSS